MEGLSFFVEGTPITKGSARMFFHKTTKKPIVIQDNQKRQKPWVDLIRTTATAFKENQNFKMVTGAASVRLTFHLQRAKSHYTKTGLGMYAPRYPVGKGRNDLDKLARCVVDALTGICWTDDGQVVELLLHKYYADDHKPGVYIEVQELV
jgi:crossover junction endodeoxyribonuclease RusA